MPNMRARVPGIPVSSSQTAATAPPFATFREFYPYYLAQHRSVGCRRLHLLGTLLAILLVALGLGGGHPAWLLVAPVAGYGPAWLGHWLFEHNLPATFRHPLYSLCGDFVMLAEVLTGRMRG
jgi:hypothetical protein